MIVTQIPAGVPQTAAEYRALISKRGELSDQLISAASRRKDLGAQLLTADPSARGGIQARLKVLDDRIVRLETEIDRTGDQAIDTIAIEVERISEGQRFVAKMMSERERSAIGAGAAEPLRNSMKSAIPSER